MRNGIKRTQKYEFEVTSPEKSNLVSIFTITVTTQ